MPEIIQIKSVGSEKLTKQQRKFNEKIQKISELKQKIDWAKNELEIIQRKIIIEILPLEKRFTEVQIKQLAALDKLYYENNFRKRDNDTLSELILEKAEELIKQNQSKEVHEIFARHNDGISYDEMLELANQKASANIKNSIKTIFGVENEMDFNKPEDFQDFLNEQLESDEFKYENRKKKRKLINNNAEENNKNQTLTARQVYLELVKVFHPDREQDENEKEKKNLIMQKIIEAYEKNDIYELINMKFELLQVHNASDESLKIQIQLLNKQIEKLENEITELYSFGRSSFFGKSLIERFGGDQFQNTETKFTKEINNLKKIIKHEEKMLPFYYDENQVLYLIEEFRLNQHKNKKLGNFYDIIEKM
ncbi:hypothetical protein Emtol_4155 [Emticicia oligotrophica DSM 17448]|uniref:J domain-containing protein n=1 Tax=Emticicia oligotrophica (strain DSM 17448 / CIP 109782 / MTCC 6937 / GPTSA100-15) TaxID=929562 RepID=A0ABN4ARR5_EMTOG|nr:hypothetical protein [Emticicia oligotrophica]AFK05280.1 hypothetical protein Emtol_4155 [Emticicia oligotrophica DSM 17448]